MDIPESDNDSDDGWYAQMEQQGQQYDDYYCDSAVGATSLPSCGDVEVSEDEYFRALADNTLQRDECFLSEGDLVWQNLARSVVSDKQDGLARMTSSLQTLSPGQDDCSVLLLRQWLFSFVPVSLKMYNSMSFFLLSASQTHTRRLYVDNKLHPSIVATTLYVEASNKVSISVFCPYKTFDVAAKFILQILRVERERHPFCALMFSALDQLLLEYLTAHCPQLAVQWTEHCDMYALDARLSEDEARLPAGYCFVPLQEDLHADVINDTWKYKSLDSLLMVREMIRSGHCVGIAPEGQPPQGLASWCLTYDDGALGMLFTDPAARGQSLARRCVAQTVLHHRPPELLQPFCFIELSNEPSRRLFHSLGFTKHATVVWLGVELR